jgi:valyl-tRNA synthetase
MQRVPRSQRGGEIIEPLVSSQWFVRTEGMAEKALTAVQNGEMKIVPQRFDKIWYNWLTDIRDWCVSRYVEPLKPSFAFLLYPP